MTGKRLVAAICMLADRAVAVAVAVGLIRFTRGRFKGVGSLRRAPPMLMRVRRVALLTLFGLMPLTQAQADTLSPNRERVAPGFRSYLWAVQAPLVGWYATPQEAFKVFAADFAASAPLGYSRWALNPRPCAHVHEYVNGVPYNWCVDRHQIGPPPHSAYWTDTINFATYTYRCPADGAWAGIYTAPPMAGPPQQRRIACERSVPTTQCPPNSCNGLGNPIFPEDSSKRQIELDYASPNGTLAFSRHFHSDFGGFFHSYQAPVQRAYNLEQLTGATSSSATGCFAGRMQLGAALYAPYCFPYVTEDAATGTVVMRTFSGTIMRFNAGGDAVDVWNAGSRLVPRTVSGAAGHALLQSSRTRIDYYDSQWRLAQRIFADSRQLTFLYGPIGLSSVSDQFGRSLTFGYDGSGRLSTMTDPAGGIFQYGYEPSPVVPIATCQGNGCQRIASVTYPDLKTRIYHWDESAHVVNSPNGLSTLTGITDEFERRFATYAYSGGRATSTEQAGATLRYQITQFQSNSTTIIDPRGTTRTYNFAPSGGLKVRTNVSSWCPTCSFQSAIYDGSANVASRTDFRGNKTCYAYDLTRNLETKRVEGVTSSAVCSTALSTPPAGARFISTQWHPDWRLETRIAEPKKLTTLTYNGQGASCAPSTVLVDGKPPAVICTRTEQATTDETGASGFAATVTGTARTWRYTYTTYGRVLTATDPNDRVTSYTYHADNDADFGKRGNVTSITNAASHVTHITDYNPHGQPTRIVDPNGVMTVLTYDPRMRLTSRTVGNEATAFGYDPVGQMTSVNLPDGARLTYTYDAAHRLTAINDHKGNRIDYTLDAMGNRTAEQMKDPAGVLVGNIARVIDALNRVERITGATQ